MGFWVVAIISALFNYSRSIVSPHKDGKDGLYVLRVKMQSVCFDVIVLYPMQISFITLAFHVRLSQVIVWEDYLVARRTVLSF